MNGKLAVSAFLFFLASGSEDDGLLQATKISKRDFTATSGPDGEEPTVWEVHATVKHVYGPAPSPDGYGPAPSPDGYGPAPAPGPGPSPDEPFPIYFDGLNRTDTLRTRYPGVPLLMAFRYRNPSSQGIVVNDTHVWIPFGQMLQAEFVRNMPSPQVHEYGIANSIFAPTPPSKFPGNSLVASMEKSHTLVHDGPWPRTSYEFYLQDQNRSASVDAVAREKRLLKTTLANMMVMGVGMQFPVAGSDPLDMQVASNLAGHEPPEHLVQQSRGFFKNLAGASEYFQGTEIASSSLNCLHLESDAGPVELDGDGFAIARKIAIKSFRGQTIAYPLQHFSFARGIAFVDYVEDELQIISASSTYFDAVDIDGLHLSQPPQLFVGTFDYPPDQTALHPDYRHSMQLPSEELYGIWKMYASIPLDYEHMFEEGLCGKDSLEFSETKRFLENFNASEFALVKDSQDMTAEQKQMMMSGFAETVAKYSDCFTTLLRGPVAKSHGWGLNQAIPVLHALQELPPNLMADMFMNKQWNELNLYQSS